MSIKMKIKKVSYMTFRPVTLAVKAKVRYWEDALINGKEDAEGTLTPLRFGEFWEPVIILNTGRIKDWPEGVNANIHFKVCDSGTYSLNDNMGVIAEYKSEYVPDILSVGDDGFGDHIIMEIDTNGFIENWCASKLSDDEWRFV